MRIPLKPTTPSTLHWIIYRCTAKNGSKVIRTEKNNKKNENIYTYENNNCNKHNLILMLMLK